MRRIVAWLNKKERRRLEKLNEKYKFEFIFVESFEEFEELVDRFCPDVIPVFLRCKASRHYTRLVKLISKNRELAFFSYPSKDCYAVQVKESLLSEEENVILSYGDKFFSLLKIKTL